MSAGKTSIGSIIKSLINIQQYYKPARALLGVAGIVLVLILANTFGVFSPKFIVGAAIVFLFWLLFTLLGPVTNPNKKHSPLIIILAYIICFVAVLVFILFFTSIFFDLPKPIRVILGFSSSIPDNSSFINENSKDWRTLMFFQRSDTESCKYPIMLPDSILGKKINEDSATIPMSFIRDSISAQLLAKAPAIVNGYWGFSVPFTLESRTKNSWISLQNTFKVKVTCNQKYKIHANAESTCGGEGAFYESNEYVILESSKPYYEKKLSFPKADFYTLKPNEVLGFEINFKIKDLGSYSVTVDIPYVYKGKRGVATLKLPDCIAPKEFDEWSWSFDNTDTTKYVMYKNLKAVWKKDNYKITILGE